MEFPATVEVQGIPGITATIYRQTQSKRAKIYTRYVVSYSLLGKRKLEAHSDLVVAQAAAEMAIKRIAGNEQAALKIVNEDAYVYLRAKEHAAKLGVPLDVAVGQLAEVVTALGGLGTPLEAAREFVRRQAGNIKPISIPDAAAAMLAQEEAQRDGKRKRAWCKLLKAHVVNNFADNFNEQVGRIESRQINEWLSKLDCAERTKKNARDCLSYFFRWCQGQSYLARDADPMRYVADYRKRRRGAIEVLKPDDLKSLLAKAGGLMPYIALRAFAGLRDSEATAIEWRHIDLKDGWIEITEHVAKLVDKDEGSRRLIPVRACLKAWLLTVKKRKGRACPFDNTAKQIAIACSAAGVKWKRNCLRHSYISYAVAESNDIPAVAIHSGNSPAIIRKHYLRVVKPAQAKKWFSVIPHSSSHA